MPSCVLARLNCGEARLLGRAAKPEYAGWGRILGEGLPGSRTCRTDDAWRSADRPEGELRCGGRTPAFRRRLRRSGSVCPLRDGETCDWLAWRSSGGGSSAKALETSGPGSVLFRVVCSESVKRLCTAHRLAAGIEARQAAAVSGLGSVCVFFGIGVALWADRFLLLPVAAFRGLVLLVIAIGA